MHHSDFTKKYGLFVFIAMTNPFFFFLLSKEWNSYKKNAIARVSEIIYLLY